MAEPLSSDVFEWGEKQAGTTCSFESMRLKGVWYTLYDYVFCRSGRTKPYVGKLMRLYEENGVKRVRIRWFFRPEELPLFVRKDFPSNMLQSKELFIGLGSGVGVENENSVNVICGKAMVLCTAKVKENPLPSRAQLDNAHHFFNRAYDVGKKKLVRIGRILNKVLVDKMCNKAEWLVPIEIMHGHSDIEEIRDAIVVSEEEYISSALGPTCVEEEKNDLLNPLRKAKAIAQEEKKQDLSNPVRKAKATAEEEKKEDLSNPVRKAKATAEDYGLSAAAVEKEKVDNAMKITSSSGNKRIFLTTSTIAPVFPLKKRKI